MAGWYPPLGVLIIGAACASAAAAADVPHAFAYEPARDAPTEQSATRLTLEEATDLALQDQPMLEGREATIEAAQHQAVAAAQLPDPKLSTALRDVPIDTAEAFSLRRDSFTEYTIGLSQEFPRAEKRRLKGARQWQNADIARSALENDRRAIRRDAALAWLDVYEAEQALSLTGHLLDEAQLQTQALAKEYSAAKASQADWYAARIDAELISDKLHDWRHHALKAREALARWIGDEAAQRPLADSLLLPSAPKSLPLLITAADQHPVINGLDRQIDASATDVALARQSYKPDFSVEFYTAYRQDYADFIGFQFTVGLPYFTKNRQDQQLAGALQETRAAQARKLDALRELHAQVGEDYVDWQHYSQRVADFDGTIIPDAKRRVDAARESYAAGKVSFESVLSARRAELEVQLQRLALSLEAARAQVRLDYLTAAKSSTGDAP